MNQDKKYCIFLCSHDKTVTHIIEQQEGCQHIELGLAISAHLEAVDENNSWDAFFTSCLTPGSKGLSHARFSRKGHKDERYHVYGLFVDNYFTLCLSPDGDALPLSFIDLLVNKSKLMEKSRSDSIFNEIMELNNELHNTKRQLSRKNMELEKERKRYKEVSELSSDVSYAYRLHDGIFQVEWITDSFERITGRSKSDARTLDKLDEIVHPEEKERAKNRTAKLLKGQQTEMDIRIINPSENKIHWVRELRKAEKNESGAITRIIGSMKDITRQKETEKAEEEMKIALRANEVKQQFLANMSHEMRTPMNGIIGVLDILRREQKSQEEIKALLNIMQSSAESLMTLLNDILDISLLDNEMMQLTPSRFELRAFINQMKDLYTLPAREKGLEIRVDIQGNAPKSIYADKNRLHQVVSNLLSNAIKYTGEGQITLRARLVDKEGGKHCCRIEVEDTGPGIAPEDQEEIFEYFTRLPGSEALQIEGAGLGLAISRQIATLMKGQLNVESTPGKGSIFYIDTELPKEQRNAEETKKKTRETKPGEKAQLNLNILYAEDKKTNQIVMSMMVEQLGCRCETANNGKEAVEMALKNDYDVILMDIRMPLMDGMEACHLIRQSTKKAPPIISVTANAFEHDKRTYLMSGFSGHLSKPVKSEELLGELLKHRPQTDKKGAVS